MADTTYNPQQPSNLNSTGSNQTTRFFNNFFTPNFTVNSNTNDAIVSYFEGQTGNLESARLLAQAVIDTAQTQRQNPMDVLSEFQKLENYQLTPFLALYLNNSRVPTSYLGVNNVVKSNPLASRLVVNV